MKIVFIAPYPDITALGVRYLSAYLETHHFDAKILFIPAPLKAIRFHSEFLYPYSESELGEIAEFCRDADLIGLSFMSNYVERATQITRSIREKTSTPIIWGGIHATACPEASIAEADMICRGESEEALLELCTTLNNKEIRHDIANIWFRTEKSIIKNEVRPLIKDLDSIPFPDFRYNVHGVLDRDRQKVYILDESLTAQYLTADAISKSRDPSSKKSVAALYQTIATRGCPHRCTFCYNSQYRVMYHGQRYLRRRSVSNIIAELEQVCSNSDIIRYIVLCDDSFFAASSDEIRQFAALYKEKIGLPFHCLGSPQTITPEKLKILVDAGLTSISMGIQSGCHETNVLYDRRFREEEVLKAAETIHAFIPQIGPPAFDFIIDNPYESLDQQLETLRFIQKLPRPYHLCLGSLVFFPGSVLHQKAREDGFLRNELEQIYRKEYHGKSGSYINLLFYLSSFMLPQPLMRLLLAPAVVKLFSLPVFNPFFLFFFRGTRDLRLLVRWLKK